MFELKNKVMFLAIIGMLAVAVWVWVGWRKVPQSKLPEGVKVDSLVVLKSARTMMAYAQGEHVRTYYIALGQQPIGHKEVEGDMKTPEGIYSINDRNPNSAYHKNLGISYPNEADIAHAQSLGKSAGGDIKIHGLKNGRGSIGRLHRQQDWTHGCIAVTNEEMDELYESVEIGATIVLKP